MPTPAKVVENAASVAGLVDEARDIAHMWQSFQAQMRLGKLYKATQRTPGLSLALGAIEGAAKSFDDASNGQREKWMATYGAQPSGYLETAGWDGLRTAQDIGNALTFNQANRIGEMLFRSGK